MTQCVRFAIIFLNVRVIKFLPSVSTFDSATTLGLYIVCTLIFSEWHHLIERFLKGSRTALLGCLRESELNSYLVQELLTLWF